MADDNVVQDPEKVKAAEETERFKKRLKDEYGIEDDAEAFKEKRTRWSKAEEEIPQYQATLNALVAHYRSIEEQPTEPVIKADDENQEETRLRTISKLDPYEGTKRQLQRFEKVLDEKLRFVREEGHQVAQGATLHRETLRRSKEIVEQNWPEAFDQKSELFRMGHQIYNQEMSQNEQRDPRAFLIATERAAGRIGLPPKGKRGSTTRRAEVSAQNVSRQGSGRPSDDEHSTPLTARQKQIIEGLGVDEKTYRAARRNRKEQGKKLEDDE